MKKRNPSVTIVQPIVRLVSLPLISLTLSMDLMLNIKGHLKHYTWQRLYQWVHEPEKRSK